MYYADLQKLWCRPMSDAACDWPWVICLELSAIHNLRLPLQGLFICRKTQTVRQGLLLPAPFPGMIQLNSQSPQRSALVVKLNHAESLQLYSSAAHFKLHWVEQSNSCRQGYCFPSDWCHLELSAVPKKMASALWGMTQHRNPGCWFFSSLPRATSPRLSSCISGPLCHPTARIQGQWLQVEFRALAF